MQIIFGRAGNIKGAVIQTYLLEKSRVITLDPGERSYHIFYQVGERKVSLQSKGSRLTIASAPQLCAAAQSDSKLFDKLHFKQAGGANPRNFSYLVCIVWPPPCRRTCKPTSSADPASTLQATSNTYECSGIKDGDEFERLKASLAAFDIKDEARQPKAALERPLTISYIA